MYSAHEHNDTEMTNALLAAPDQRLPQSGAWLIVLALGPHSSFAPAGVQRQSSATRCRHSSSLGARRGKCWNSSGTSSPFLDLL